MREIADLLLVFLLNLIASTGGGEPPAKTMAAAKETSAVAAAPAALAPICESAPILISVPTPPESELVLLARLKEETVVKDFHSFTFRKVHRRTRVTPPRAQEPL